MPMFQDASNPNVQDGMFYEIHGNLVVNMNTPTHPANVGPWPQPAPSSQGNPIGRPERFVKLTKSDGLTTSLGRSQNLSTPKKTRTISVEVDLGTRILCFPEVPLPLTFEKVCQHIQTSVHAEREENNLEGDQAQINKADGTIRSPARPVDRRPENSMWMNRFIVEREKHHIRVTDGPSTFTTEEGGYIDVNQPLLHFYHKCFLPATAVENPEPTTSRKEDASVSKARISQDHGIDVGGVRLRFHRTVRIPDNDKTYPLPADMGAFEVFSIADYAERLPESIVSKGGVFISMYQREAMWTSFKSCDSGSHAVKISVGDVNALTGQPKGKMMTDAKQDYLAVNDNGQLWLDGICVAPGVVRQFVAMPLGQGYTVEGQITGKEDIGGLQVDVFNAYPRSVEFTQDRKCLSLFKTPLELGLKISSTLIMEDLGTPEELHYYSREMNVIGPNIKLKLLYHDMASRVMPSSEASGYSCEPWFGHRDLGFAAGGRISQKIIRDRLPPTAYDQDGGKRLHIAVLNSVYFTTVTGRPPPPSPISASTYEKLQFPWYTLYDENIPGVPHSPEFSIQSIAGIDTQRETDGQNTETQANCGYCAYEMATMWLSPCTHVMCDGCAAGLSKNSCPSCDVFVEKRERFAAPMPLPGNENGVDAKAELIVALKRYRSEAKDTAITFMRSADIVSPLRGAAE